MAWLHPPFQLDPAWESLTSPSIPSMLRSTSPSQPSPACICCCYFHLGLRVREALKLVLLGCAEVGLARNNDSRSSHRQRSSPFLHLLPGNRAGRGNPPTHLSCYCCHYSQPPCSPAGASRSGFKASPSLGEQREL